MAILFLHGLEGSPKGKKSVWLQRHYEAVVPQLDTTEAKAFLAQRISSPDTVLTDTSRIFEAPLASALAHINQDTTLIIGSSFGGAVLAEIVRRGGWTGPCLFLASAHAKLSRLRRFSGHSICIHGYQDKVVPPEPIENFVRRSGPPHEFWGVHDEHPLYTIRSNGMFASAIEQLTT